MPTLEGLFAIACLLLAGGIVGVFLFRQVRIEPGRVIRANDFTDEKLRQAARLAVSKADISGLSREKAQELLQEIGRHALAVEYSKIYNKVGVEVTESWPVCTCIISGNIAVLEPWVGHTFDGEGIKPINVEINRQPAKLLSNRPAIKSQLDTIFAPPAKTDPAPVKIAAAAGAKPAPTQKPGPVKREPPKRPAKK